MCSDPQTFINKETGEKSTGACLRCDECIAARRAGWVARGVAEKTQWKHAVCVSLTYDDNAPGGYDAARFFAYGDVRAFVQRVTAALRRIDKALAVRFICAGEQGDRNGRCHWHLVLYSDYDLRQLGTVRFCSADLACYQDGKRLRWGDVITDPEAMMTVGKDKRRLHWSLWAVDKQPLGFVSFGAADEAGISYVLSYCLKDQFTFEKSEGTSRVAKSENFATGLFRMSKRPAIGEAWLMQKLQDLDDKSAVLPNTNLKVPGLSGYWYPSGVMRKKLLRGLRAINQRRIGAGLGDAPQWSGLLEACKDNPSDLEILNGPQAEEHDEIEIGETIRRKSRWIADEQRRGRKAAYRRDYETVCQSCLDHRGESIKAYRQGSLWRFVVAETGAFASGKEFIIERHGTDFQCETCGSSREVWAVRRDAKA